MTDPESIQLRSLGLIAGNGKFPLLVAEEAAKLGVELVIAAIREEADLELEKGYSSQTSVQFHWVGLGQLGKLIRIFQDAGITQAIMAGQVRHNKIFAPTAASARRLLSARPDWRMMRLLMTLPRKNTASLIGGITGELASEGIELLESTILLRHLMPAAGVLTERRPNTAEQKDIDYGRPIAREIARLDLGQTIVVKDQAVVAIEAMEGTDETIQRASRLVDGQRLTVIKVSRPEQDMRFDVPVLGSRTLAVLQECRVSALAIDAGRTLILELDHFISQANRQRMCIVAE